MIKTRCISLIDENYFITVIRELKKILGFYCPKNYSYIYRMKDRQSYCYSNKIAS